MPGGIGSHQKRETVLINIDKKMTVDSVMAKIDRLWELSAEKIMSIHATHGAGAASPVFTESGTYTAQGWTEWTQGFQYGSALLQFDATGDESFLEMGRRDTVDKMATHITHTGVHDHGFNNVSTYGTLLRLAGEGRFDASEWERDFYRLALKSSGAVQAGRWTPIEKGGYVHSFNGPHSLFADTMRSLRSLSVAHRLGHTMMGEQDRVVSLLKRIIQHAAATAEYTVYYGEGRDSYDCLGRVAHESIFNTTDGCYRCPNSQQGYSPFSTWTRGLAWVMVGFAEQFEYIQTVDDVELDPFGGRLAIETLWLKAARATCDFYIDHSPTDGIPYWDTGAPGLVHLEGYLDRPSEPDNGHEPVDSSAAAIGAQGLLRLGSILRGRNDSSGDRYWQAGLTVLDTLFGDRYLSGDSSHQGLILHSVYHRPNGWDHIPKGKSVPFGESSMWGDYHARELALYVQRIARGGPYYTFFDV